jgi:hypothetical protein
MSNFTLSKIAKNNFVKTVLERTYSRSHGQFKPITSNLTTLSLLFHPLTLLEPKHELGFMGHRYHAKMQWAIFHLFLYRLNGF